VTILQERIEAYRQRTGSLPSSWQNLIAAGLIRNVPRDPTGAPYILRWDGRVLVQHPEDLPFISKGMPGGQ
jgi:hypothetical protein